MIPVLPKLLGGERVDRIGAAMSSVCAVHCALGALLPAALGALGLGALFGHEAEWAFTLGAIAFAGFALVSGWRRHRSALVAALLIFGMAGLLASRVMEMGDDHHDAPGVEHHDDHHDAPHDEQDEDTSHDVGAALGVAAGLLLVAGHLLGIRRARCCDEEECA